jgi:chitinase
MDFTKLQRGTKLLSITSSTPTLNHSYRVPLLVTIYLICFFVANTVNFAFFQTDAQGNIWGTDSWADPNVLFGPYNWNPTEGSVEYCSWDSPTERACSHHNYEQGLIHLVHAAGAEIFPSIGGWTLSDAFPSMAASETARATFAQNCVSLISDYGFDGNY